MGEIGAADEWTVVETDEDVDTLLVNYADFHDSCLVELHFSTGSSVEGSYMSFGMPEQKELHMIFNSQWKKEQPLELCFTGVRKFCVAGWQERYESDIFSAYLKIHRDLETGRDEPLVVWADEEEFSPEEVMGRDLLEEPMTTYVVATGLKWRLLQK